MICASDLNVTSPGKRVTNSFRIVALSWMLAASTVFPADSGQPDQDCSGAGSYDLPTLWRSVDAVAYLRIRQTSDFRPRYPESGFSHAGEEHEASVFEVFRRYRGTPAGASLKFLRVPEVAEMPAGGTPERTNSLLHPGEECIAFLHWNDAEDMFEALLVLPVRNGQVRSFCIDEIFSPMKTEIFLIKLRSMKEARPAVVQ